MREKLEEQGLAAKPDSAAQGDDGTAAGAEYEAAVRRLIEDEVDSINAQWPEWKKVKHVVIRKRDFNKTTGMKIRRFVEDNKLGE